MDDVAGLVVNVFLMQFNMTGFLEFNLVLNSGVGNSAKESFDEYVKVSKLVNQKSITALASVAVNVKALRTNREGGPADMEEGKRGVDVVDVTEDGKEGGGGV